MKKIYFVVMIAAVLMMTGCTKIKTNKLQGLWSSEPIYSSQWGFSSRYDVYNFINSNTVINYGQTCDEPDEFYINKIPGHPDWVYNEGLKVTWTYVFEDNKVILSSGTIFTYMDGKLYKDGSSTVLSPW